MALHFVTMCLDSLPRIFRNRLAQFYTLISGVPLETLELSSEFGLLNFEQLPEDPELKAQISKLNEEFSPPSEDSEFEEEMEKVVKIMKIAGNDLPVSTIKTLMTDLVKKAKENSANPEEEKTNLSTVKGLVGIFKEANAQRAQESFEGRRPNARPVQDEMEQIIDSLPSQREKDLAQILIEKAKSKPTKVPDFNVGLELPVRNQRPRLHVKAKNASHILINKAKNRPSNVRDFDSGLEVPVFNEKPSRINSDDFLTNKAKARPSKVKDFNVGLSVPNSFNDEFEEEFAIDVPESTTTLESPSVKVMNLSDILAMPKSKELIEDHIMDMILESPDRAAADLAGLFNLNNEDDKVETEKELHEMMEKDPLAVTAAFTDLIIAQKSTPIGATASPPIPSTPVFEPVRIEDVPEAVKGKMERMKMKPNDQPQQNRPNSNQQGTRVEVASKPLKTIEVSNDLLDQMMKLIESGQLSHKEVIEEMINNGLLPVAVTEIGKIPIIVGAADGKKQIQVQKSQPLRRLPPHKNMFRDAPPREAINLERLRQLDGQGPKMVMRDHHDFIKEVDIKDPDFDFEMVSNPHASRQPAPLTEAKTTEASPEEKDIEILSSMMDLYEQGLISDNELEQMVVMMEKEGVLDVDLQELGIEVEQVTTPEPDVYNYANFNFKPLSGPAVDEVKSIYGYKQGIKPFIDTFAKEELSRPFKNGVGENKPSSYSTFTMGRPRALTSTPRPPSLPPPSAESVHNAPFFEDLRMNNPFEGAFEDDFHSADMGFIPKPTQASRPETDTVKPGPAPPAWLSARLPAPPSFNTPPEPELTILPSPPPSPRFKTPESEFEFLPITSPRPFHSSEVEKEMFDILRSGPREPFPPVSSQDLKRQVPSLVLKLHAHEGTDFERPHFDVPKELLDPDSFYRSPKKILPHHHQQRHQHQHHHNRNHHRSSNVPYQSFNDFLPRQGRLASTFSLIPMPGLPGITATFTGSREVDRRIDKIRQSYERGDELGSATSAFE